MSFYYIQCNGQRYPLWDYFMVNELSNLGGNIHYRLIKPAQIAITQTGLSFLTNQRDGSLVVFDSRTLSLKATHSLNTFSSSAGDHGPWPTATSSISPDIASPTCYIIPKSKPLENKKLCIVTPQESGKFINVSTADIGTCNQHTVCGGPVGCIYLGNAKEECVYTYDLSRGYKNTLKVDCTPSALAYDKNKRRIHVCDSYTNTIKVFSTDGNLCYEYGKRELVMPQQVIINNDSYSFVVCCFNLRCYLAVFDGSGSFLYSVHGFGAPNGVGIGPDGSVWVSDSNKHCLTSFANLSNVKLPFPLSFTCYKTVLLNLSDINISAIPQRYSQALQEWDQTVDILIRRGGGTDSDGHTHQQCLTLRLKHQLPIDVVKWMLCERLGLSSKTLLVFREREGGKHVQQLQYYMDHLIVDRVATPTTTPPSLMASKTTGTSSKKSINNC